MYRPLVVLIAALALLPVAGTAPALAQSGQQHVVASANGGTATSSANEGEIQSCDASGCQFAITAPARPPTTWNGEVPATNLTVVELRFARPVELLGATVVTRNFDRIIDARPERVDDQHWRVVIPSPPLPERAALELRQRWTGEDSRGRHTVHRTDYVGLVAPASLLGATQQRGRGPVADVDMRAPGRIDARLALGNKTLGTRMLVRESPARFAMAVPLSRGARRLLSQRRRLKATLVLTVRVPSGDPLELQRRVTLRAQPR